jgi:hypothetical protein
MILIKMLFRQHRGLGMIIRLAMVEGNITEQNLIYSYNGNYSNPHIRI